MPKTSVVHRVTEGNNRSGNGHSSDAPQVIPKMSCTKCGTEHTNVTLHHKCKCGHRMTKPRFAKALRQSNT